MGCVTLFLDIPLHSNLSYNRLKPLNARFIPKKNIKQVLENCNEARGGGGGGTLPSNRLMGMCRWMGSHFHDWIDYNGVTFSIELLEWGRIFLGFWGKNILASLGIKKNIGRFAVQK